jgi:predicted nucleic acid-binding protein
MSPTDPRTGESGRSSIFVDTNVFLRFFTNDVPEQAARAEALFRDAASGKVELVTNAMVMAELVWVLESYYGLTASEVRERVVAVVCTDGLFVPDGDLIIDALMLYETSAVDYVDAYNLCWMKQRELSQVGTFDKKHYARFEDASIHSL